MIKRRKDRSNLAGTLRLKASRKPHYVQVYVWKAKADLMSNTLGMPPDTAACWLPNAYRIDLSAPEIKPQPYPLLGEIHLHLEEWDEEIVGHELMHAVLHRMVVLPPYWATIQEEHDAEEEICYEFGRWLDQTWRFIWKLHRPNFKIVDVVLEQSENATEGAA